MRNHRTPGFLQPCRTFGLIGGILLLMLILAETCFCQQEWQRVYGGGRGDIGYSVQQTLDGGYIVAGGTASYGAGGGDVYLIKTDPSGDTLWTRTYGGTNAECGYSVQQTSDSGYIVAGSTDSYGTGGSDVYLIKTNASGDSQWTRTYGGTSDDWANSVQQTFDGGYIIVGTTWSFGAGECDVYLIRTDSSGDTLWTRTYGGTWYDEGNSVQQTKDGGFIVGSTTFSFGLVTDAAWLIKTDSLGDTVWTHVLGGRSNSEYHEGNAVRQTLDGGYVLAGIGACPPSTGGACLIKTDSSGDTLWARSFGKGDDRAYSVQQTPDSGYIMAGVAHPGSGREDDVYLVRTDARGDTLWTRSFGGPDIDDAYSVQQTSDGGYIVAGETYSFGGGDTIASVYLIKTDPQGQSAVREVTLPSNRAKPRLTITAAPSPFTSRTMLSCRLPPGTLTAVLQIQDATGRLVRTIGVVRPAAGGAAQCEWDGANARGRRLPPGCYFCVLHAGAQTALAKAMLAE